MPAASAGTAGHLLVLGVNHRTSSAILRDRFALVEADLDSVLETLGADFREAVLLATCDRVELIAQTAEAGRAQQRFTALLVERCGLPAEEVTRALYRHEDEAALAHLFRVASALESAVIGDSQVLGQMKTAHRAAAASGLVGGELETVFAAAYAAARRVRRETRIAERPVSIAAAALGLARDIHGELDRRALLVLGPSEMGELMAEQFQRAGMTNLVICGPEPRAKLAAEQLGANRIELDELDGALVSADIVIAALGSGRAVLTKALVGSVLKRRRLRPLFVIDVGFPADAEPGVNDLDGAFRYDLVDLERIALTGREWRETEADDARRIIDAELAAFVRRRDERKAVPAVVALREHVEQLRQEALSEAKGDAEMATRLLMNRLLHDPSEVLRGASAASNDAEAMEDLLRRLFRLGGEKGEEK